MNQILFVKENNHSVDTKKVVLFFAISILLFGVILLGEGAYSLYQNKLIEKTHKNPPASGQQENPPTISLTRTEDNKIIMNIESTVAISHIIYSWNNDAAQTIDETGKTNIEEIINLPAGENVLHLSVIDSNGIETKKTETYVLETSRPVIELSVVGDNIKISVTSEADLSSVTYQWNIEEPKKQDMATYEDRTKFEKIIEIPKGQNTLKIIATDVTGNETEKSQEIKGVIRAKTSTIARGEYIEFTVEAEENIQSVEFTFNGHAYKMTTETFGQTNKVHYKVKMVNGINYLKVVSTTRKRCGRYYYMEI